MTILIDRIKGRLKREIALQTNRVRVRKISSALQNIEQVDGIAPVVIFNASTRLSGLSQNAGFSLMTGFALRAQGVPIIQFVCQRGLNPCVLGTNRDDPGAAPPCGECVRTSRFLFAGSETHPFSDVSYPALDAQTAELGLPALLEFVYEHIPLGKLILPSLRWILRKHHLSDDEATRALARAYIRSAWNVYSEFSLLLNSRNPQAVIVFNGMFYPEAMARLAAQEKGIPVYSHEVGMLPYSAFITEKEATAYPVTVDNDFNLDSAQNSRLDAYLSRRVSGQFQTAGVTFWPEMKELDAEIDAKIASHQAMVPVFTNVIFDTSQAHANTLFEHMFAWLELVVEKVKQHPEILFILRAHPDEVRKGKESRESVADWYKHHLTENIPNLILIRPDEFISSYALIRRAKFVMVYNSTVGLEASILGKPVLCAGKARYTQIPTVFFPGSQEAYEQQLDTFLAQEKIDHPESFVQNARRVLYSQLFRASIPFDDFLQEDSVWQGYVQIKDFDPALLGSAQTDEMRLIVEGVLHGKPFIRNI